MPKGYWGTAHRRPADPEKRAAYGKFARSAIEAGGGKFLAVSDTPQAREFGLEQRIVLIEFPTYEAALEAYDSPAYQKA